MAGWAGASGGSDDGHLSPLETRARQSLVTGQQRRAEGFGQCEIAGVVGGEVAAKLPNSIQMRMVRMTDNQQAAKILERLRGTSRRADPQVALAPERVRNFKIQYVRRMDSRLQSPLDLAATGGIRQQLQGCGSVQYGHRLSRILRMVTAAGSENVTGSRWCNWSSHSSRVGNSAMGVNSAIR